MCIFLTDLIDFPSSLFYCVSLTILFSDQSRRTADESTTILLGEGVVGRCAQQRCLQVYRQAVITDGVYSQKRMYCSMNVPVPEDASNINGKLLRFFCPHFQANISS